MVVPNAVPFLRPMIPHSFGATKKMPAVSFNAG